MADFGLFRAATTLGRDQEKYQLMKRLEAWRQDHIGGLAIVEGEAGLGKTHQIRDLVTGAVHLR